MSNGKIVPFRIPKKKSLSSPMRGSSFYTRLLCERGLPYASEEDILSLPQSMCSFLEAANRLVSMLQKRALLSPSADIFSELSALALDVREIVSGNVASQIDDESDIIIEIRSILSSEEDGFDFLEYVKSKIKVIKQAYKVCDYSSLYENLYGVIFWPLIYRKGCDLIE